LYNSYAVKYLLSKFRTTCIKSFPQVEAENFVYRRTDGDRSSLTPIREKKNMKKMSRRQRNFQY